MHKAKVNLEQETAPKKKSRFSYQNGFYSDYSFPGMLYGAIIRSGFSGSFSSIQTDGLPEGYTVITAEDIPGNKFIESPDGKNSVPVFCQEQISYQGEPLGMVVGPDEEKVIELRGFGTFEVRTRKGREKARNPKTGDLVAVDTHGVAVFRPGKELKDLVWNLRQEN